MKTDVRLVCCFYQTDGKTGNENLALHEFRIQVAPDNKVRNEVKG